MREWRAFTAITRRALSIIYKSPLVCEFAEASGSGSGGNIAAVLGIEQTNRRAGPLELFLDGTFLSWSSQSYVFSYTIYRSTTGPDGPFELFSANIVDLHFDISGLTAGDSWFKVTGVEPDFGETFASPVLMITIP